MRYHIYIILSVIILFSIEASAQQTGEVIPIELGINVRKAVYTGKYEEHKSFYNWMWGDHYRKLYYDSVTVKSVSFDSIFRSMSVRKQIPNLHALILQDKSSEFYMLKPLGGSSSFLESKFFTDFYRRDDFKDTYLDEFLQEAYTIIHPYIFTVSERLAKSAGLGIEEPSIFYMSGSNNKADTISERREVSDRLISISQLSEVDTVTVINNIDSLMWELHENSLATVDRKIYIKARLFDMLIGDWNKIPENWYWIPSYKGDSVIYRPQSLDRSHAFSRVDGVFFKELLNMLGVGFITNYENRLKDIKKFNKLSYALDIALTQNSTIEDWVGQAQLLMEELTDEVIDNAFLKLPLEMQNEEAEEIKNNLKSRKLRLDNMASKYYLYTQKTPVITGTNRDEKYIVDEDGKGQLRIRIYNKDNGNLILDKQYTRQQTKEIWLYGLGGNDEFEIDKKTSGIPLLIIGGKGTNEYMAAHADKVSIYEAQSEEERLKSLKNIKVVIPDEETALDYDYQKLRYTDISVTPIGVYDSDLGLNLGTSVAHTIYGFRRAPYTRRHQISYDYVNGFTYQGIFPTYDRKKSLHVVAYIGSPAYFSNFFGFGNNTNGYKGEKNNYNRVNISKYMLTPALYYNIKKDQKISLFSSFEVYKVKNPKGRDRFINTIYEDGDPIYSPQYFMNLGAIYEISKKLPYFISKFDFSVTAGWYVNLENSKRNYAYTKGKFGFNLKFSDRISFATQVKGTILFSNEYEFYQAATTELRGFRDNRFIGQKSLYQYSDIRFDMGELNNPLAPAHYGLFAGIDHGRVWYEGDDSKMWHSSYGGGFWLTLFRKYTGKFSYFGSTDGSRFMFQFGMGF
ncbi:MAG: hypothetical protein LBV43_11635 [Prevotella sp.]|jgi:hypothetical protein|nr:hypothetical protein [Prevotella sp.]